jgi:BASS family bile acid:Na+ symporter
MDAAAVDQISLNFSKSGLLSLNAVIGLMMYGMALDMKLDDFKWVPRSPKGPAIGLGAQFVLLPAFTFLLTLVLIFQFFAGLGGMAIIAGWWGVWHIISGLTMAFFWSRRPLATLQKEAAVP